MEPLKVLTMPFQAASLLFVAVTSLLLGLIISAGWAAWIIAIFAIWSMLVWLTNYALRMIDDAANGVREAGAASWEMMSEPALDSRCWIHPILGMALSVFLQSHPEWPVWPTLLAAAMFLPASLGACVVTGHALDALHPGTMLRVVRGLGPWYALLVVFVAICGMLAALVVRYLNMRYLSSIMLTIASLELLVLFMYAAIGGALYERRLELGFEPRASPERAAERLGAARNQRRQQFMDGLYNDMRMRKTEYAVTRTRQWLGSAQPTELAGDVHAILAAGRNWQELREYPRVLQGLLPVLLEMKQPGLACTVTETALTLAPGFTATTEADAVTLVSYAFETGRRRTAAQLLDNFLKRNSDGSKPGAHLLALRERLRPPA